MWSRVPRHPLLVAPFMDVPRDRNSPFPTWMGMGGSLVLFPFLWIFGVGFAALALLSGGVVVGACASALLGIALHRERSNGRTALWAVLPCGSLGIDWLIAIRVMRMDKTLRRISDFTLGAQRIMYAVVAVIGIMLGIFATVLDPNQSLLRSNSQVSGLINAPLFQGLLLLTITGLWLLSDSFQSTQIGVAAALLTSRNGRRAVDSAAIAVAATLLIHMTVAVLAVICNLVLIAVLGRAGFEFNATGSISTLVVLVVLLREAALMLGWRMVRHVLNASPQDLDAIMTIPFYRREPDA
jgi:hypothetical protein